MNIIYKHIYLNFGVISFINKETVTFIQLHTYKFGLVYMLNKSNKRERERERERERVSE